MSTPEKRRQRAHAVEVGAAVPAGAIGTAIAAEKGRDQYAVEQPVKFARATSKAGPLRAVVEHGHVRAPVMLAGAGLGGVVYGSQRYQEQSLSRENKRQKAAAHARRVREQIGPKGAGMGLLQELAKADRTKRNVGNAALLGGGVMAYSARESQQAAGHARTAAGVARRNGEVARSTLRGSVIGAVTDAPAAVSAFKRTARPRPTGGGSHRLRAAASQGGKYAAEHQHIGDQLKQAVRFHQEVGSHEAAAARHLSAAHNKAGAAAGLLAVAAAAHASRQRPAAVPYY